MQTRPSEGERLDVWDTDDTASREDSSLGVFINYRRQDAAGFAAGRLRAALMAEFDDLQVFFDVESMPEFIGLGQGDALVVLPLLHHEGPVPTGLSKAYGVR